MGVKDHEKSKITDYFGGNQEYDKYFVEIKNQQKK